MRPAGFQRLSHGCKKEVAEMKTPGENDSFLYATVAAILRGLVKGFLLGLAFSTTSIYLAHRRRDCVPRNWP